MDDGTLRFLREALALKDVARKGWTRANIPHPESVADHSWAVALLAITLAPERGLDPARAARLAIVHDLAEAIVGDLIPGDYKTKTEKLARERAGLLTLLAHAPTHLRTAMLADFDELADNTTPEAHLIHELDKLEMALQAERYQSQGVPAERLAEFRHSARDGIHHEPWRRRIEP